MKRALAAVGLLLMTVPPVQADDDRCKDGDCCVGLIAMCDNEFPLVPGGDDESSGDDDDS